MIRNLRPLASTGAAAIILTMLAAAEAKAQTVVLGHTGRGRVVVAHDSPTTFTDAANRAQTIAPSGWEVLIRSTAAGYGAAMCAGTSASGNIRIFVSDGHPTAEAAVRAARDLARPYAAQLRDVSWLCSGGGAWRNSNTHAPQPVAIHVIGAAGPFVKFDDVALLENGATVDLASPQFGRGLLSC